MIYKRGKNWNMDVTVNGLRYREALDTTDRREALSLEKKRVGEIQSGKGASLAGRQFARKSFSPAADQYLEDRKPHTSERTQQLERNLLFPLRRFFGDRPLVKIGADDISAYQRTRRETGISGRTLNMEMQVLRQIMKKGRIWGKVAEDIKLDPENTRVVGKVLTAEQKKLLFEVASTKEDWMVVYCAAVLAVNTTCRGIELKHLKWQDVDLFEKWIMIRRSKTEAGHRPIPLNGDALASVARLRKRAETNGTTEPNHYVFPTCEHGIIDATKPQKTWRTAWRSLIDAAAKRAGNEAAETATAIDPENARRKAMAAFKGDTGRLRFHDMRHQAITELAENGASDATIQALAGHLSPEMVRHYSHVRMHAKREAIDQLSSGLMKPEAEGTKPVSKAVN